MAVEPFLKPYNYYFLKKQAAILAQTHRTVNAKSTIQAVQAQIFDKVKATLSELSEEEMTLVMGITEINDEQRILDRYLQRMKERVIPFKRPSDTGIKKAFPKTKKLTIPDWERLDLADYSFYAWNDPGQQSKFILYTVNNKLQGIQGQLSTEIKKGICTICHGESSVALFTVKGKANKDGHYKTKGNYICYNSDECNQKMQTFEHFMDFMTIVKEK